MEESMSLERVRSLGKELNDAFYSSCQNRSNYELSILNIGDHETPQRQYKQCLDELVRKVSGLGMLEIDLEEKNDERTIAIDKYKQSTDEIKKRKLDRKIRKLDICIWELHLAIEGQLREFNTLYELYNGMNKYTAKEIQEAEQEYHEKRKMGMAQRQIEAGRGVDPELIRVNFSNF